MKILKLLFSIQLVGFAFSAISLKQIIDKLNGAKHTLLSNESLFLGKLYYLLHILGNARFYHADARRKWKQDIGTFNVHIQRVEDYVANEFDDMNLVSSNPDLALTMHLFPSPTGFIEPQTSHRYNFGHIIRNNFNDGVNLIALALIVQETYKIAHNFPDVRFESFDEYLLSRRNYITINVVNRRTITLNFDFPVSETDKKLLKRNVFDTLEFLFRPHRNTEDFLLSRNLILQAFIVQLLNSDEEYDMFLAMYNHYWDTELRLSREPVIDNELVSVFRDESARFINFPYSANFQPIHSEIIKEYNRFRNSFLSHEFSNCVEYTLYHFLNCILWNPSANAYKFSSAIPRQYPILQFFRVRNSKNEYHDSKPMLGNLNIDQLKEFHRLIEDLPNGYFVDNFVTNDLFTKIAYGVERIGYRNEIFTGLINFFSVLAVLFNEETFFVTSMQKIYSELQDKEKYYVALVNFADFVKKFIFKMTGLRNEEINVVFSDVSIQNVGVKQKVKPDILGTIYVTRNFNGKKLTFSINQSTQHSYLQIEDMDKLNLSDMDAAVRVFDRYAQRKDGGFLIPLFLHDRCNIGSQSSLGNPFRDDPQNAIYQNFLQFPIGNNLKTVHLFKKLNSQLFNEFINLIGNPSIYMKEFERIASIMINIILAPFPMSNGQVIEFTEDFYCLICILINFPTMRRFAPTILPNLTDEQMNYLINLGNSLATRMPKPKSRPDVFRRTYLELIKNSVDMPKVIIDVNADGVPFVDLLNPSYIYNFIFLDSIDYYEYLIRCNFFKKLLKEMDDFAVLQWMFLHFKISHIIGLPQEFYSKKIENDTEKTIFVKELLDRIPVIMRSLEYTTESKLKNRLLNLLCYAWINSGFEEKSEVIALLSKTMNEERFFHISLYISKEKLLHYFPEKLGNTHFSGYFAKFWFNQFSTASSYTDNDFKKWISKIISKVGVPRMLLNHQNNLREYYDYHWRMLSMAIEGNFNYDLLSNYSPELLFFIGEAIYFQGARELDRSVILRPVRTSRLQIIRLRNALENVVVFGMTDAERRRIIDTFMTLFQEVSFSSNTCDAPGGECRESPIRKRGIYSIDQQPISSAT